MNRDRSEERRTPPWGHHPTLASSQPSGKQAIGHPNPRWGRPRKDGCEHDVHRNRDPGDKYLLTAEVPRWASGSQGAHARAGQLDPWGEPLHGSHDWLEGPRIPSRIGRQHDEIRATPLGLPSAHAASHPIGPGCRRGCQHPVGMQHGGRHVSRDPSSYQRPVRAPYDQGSYGLCLDRHGRHPAVRLPTGDPGPASMSEPANVSELTSLTPPPGAGSHNRTRRWQAAAPLPLRAIST